MFEREIQTDDDSRLAAPYADQMHANPYSVRHAEPAEYAAAEAWPPPQRFVRMRSLRALIACIHAVRGSRILTKRASASSGRSWASAMQPAKT